MRQFENGHLWLAPARLIWHPGACARAGVDADLGCLPEGVGRMFIRMVQDSLAEGRRGARLALAQTDKVVEVRH